MLRLLALGCCLLAACPRAVPSGSDDEEMDRLSARLEELATRPDGCPQVCPTASEACTLAGDVCTVAAGNPRRTGFQRRCADAQEQCARLRNACQRCSSR